MFNFTTVLTSVLAFLGDAMALITPTSLFGGLVTVSLSGLVMVSVIKRVKKLIR